LAAAVTDGNSGRETLCHRARSWPRGNTDPASAVPLWYAAAGSRTEDANAHLPDVLISSSAEPRTSWLPWVCPAAARLVSPTACVLAVYAGLIDRMSTDRMFRRQCDRADRR